MTPGTLEAASDAVDEARAAVESATTEDPGNARAVANLEKALDRERERRAEAAAEAERGPGGNAGPGEIDPYEQMLQADRANRIYQHAWIVINREREHRRVAGKPLLPIDIETRPGLGLPGTAGE